MDPPTPPGRLLVLPYSLQIIRQKSTPRAAKIGQKRPSSKDPPPARLPFNL
jgi:hypothetical protein